MDQLWCSRYTELPDRVTPYLVVIYYVFEILFRE
nr:MAG TPA: hypothetical protein [Caudoviricetes sp.]